MKTKSTLTLLATGALIIGSFGLIHAEEKGRSKGGKGDGSFLKEIDTNGDKSISKEEAGERWERLSKLDTDGDSTVTMKELMAARGGKGKGRPEEKPGEKPEGKPGEKPEGGKGKGKGKGERPEGGPGEMFKRADKNSDGKISKDEVPEQAWERLGKLDKDGDDAVSKEEMAAMAAMMRQRGGKGGPQGGKGKGPEGGPGAIFEKLDKDKDGKLAESEVPAEMWAKVRKADEDADGLVSKAELEKVMSKKRDGGKPEGAKPKGAKPEGAKPEGAKPDGKKKRPEVEEA